MDKKTKNEEILDELLLTIRTKRQEYLNLQAEINQLLNQKIKYHGEKEDLRKSIESLSEQKQNIDKKVNETNITYKKQLNDILQREAKISLEERELGQRQEELSNQQDTLNKERDKLSEESLELKRERAKFEDNKRVFTKEENKIKFDKSELDRQKQDFEKIKLDYQEKLKALDQKQNEAIKNLEKSEDLKDILDKKIAENNITRIQLDSLCKVNEKLHNEAKNELLVIAEKQKQFDKGILEVKEKEKVLVFKIKQQETLDNEIEIRRLRVEKLARDKGVVDELNQLEKDLGIKK